MLTREAAPPASTFVKHLTGILSPVYHDRRCKASSTAEFFPFLGPIRHLVIALQENMTEQVFALVIISFIPHGSLSVGFVCGRPPSASVLHGV